MDWVNIISLVVFPALGWLFGRAVAIEKTNMKLSTAIDNLNTTTAAIWSEIKSFREYEKRIYILEERQKQCLNLSKK